MANNFLDSTGLQYFWSLIKAKLSSKADKSNTLDNAYRIEGTGSIAGTWLGTNANITAYEDGMVILYKIPVAGASTTTLNIIGSAGTALGAKTCYLNNSTKLGTQFNANSWIRLVYNSSLNSGSFIVSDYDYNSNTYDRVLDTYYRPYAGSAIFARKLVMRGADNRLYPLVTTSGNGTSKAVQTTALRPDNVWYYNTDTTTAVNTVLVSGVLYRNMPTNNMKYTFNADCPAYNDVYLVGNYNATTGLFTLSTTNASGTASVTDFYRFVPTNSASVNYSSYFITGRYYLWIGSTNHSTNTIQLMSTKTLYYFDGTNLIPVIAKAIKADSVAWSGITGKPDLTVYATKTELADATSAYMTRYAYTTNSAIASGSTYTLPNNLSYKVGYNALLIFVNGVMCNKGTQYQEIGTTNTTSTAITISYDIPANSEISIIVFDTTQIQANIDTSLHEQYIDASTIDYSSTYSPTVANNLAIGGTVFVKFKS